MINNSLLYLHGRTTSNIISRHNPIKKEIQQLRGKLLGRRIKPGEIVIFQHVQHMVHEVQNKLDLEVLPDLPFLLSQGKVIHDLVKPQYEFSVCTNSEISGMGLI